ncbi:MAG TPA: lipid A deacylase LpxR family protein, partial [Stellaceae bacterium]
LAAIAFAYGTLAAPPSRADDPAWVTSIVEEDDFWAPHNKDRHYTHGIRLSLTSPDVQSPLWQAPFNAIASFTPAFPDQPASAAINGESIARRYNIIPLGQNMYTPENFALVNPDPRDRPYAGWLYGGIGLMQDTPGTPEDPVDRFDELALKLGIVGPGSLAHDTQKYYHLLIQVSPLQGWHAQLRNEPAGDLYYERKWRHHGETASGWGWDAIPQAGLRVGNVFDYAAAGGMVRLGHNLRVDYGPPHIDHNTGADYLNLERLTAGDWGIYFFVGGEARAVAHNIFLDGNDFKSSAHVDKIPLVGDAEGGLAFFYWHFRLAYTLVYRSNEFVHQTGPDRYGSLNLTLHLKF